MVGAVKKASRGLVRDFGEIEQLQVSKKGLNDFVSSADLRSENFLIEELSKARPEFSFLTEERGEIKGRDKYHRWIIDPLDGTINFLHGIPYFAIVVALEFNEEIIAAVTYAPIQDEFFYAEKGKGAFLNQRRLRVSGRRNMEEALISVNANEIEQDNSRLSMKIAPLSKMVSGIRHCGATALDLAYMAAGRYDAVLCEYSKPWDIAAGILLIQEARGYISDINGRNEMLKSGSIFATNESLQDPLQKWLNAKI